MKKNNDLLNNFEKIHSTELGILRIKRNLDLEIKDVVNWYVSFENYIITINAYSYTIITAHKQ
jgi:hypothetical protein